MKLSTNWKLALTLDAIAGLTVYILWGHGIIGVFEGICIILATAIIAALLTFRDNNVSN